MIKQKYPEPGEKVIGTVTKVNPFSIMIALDEYKGIEGMVHISEVSRKWVKDIREFAKEGEKTVVLVLKVEPEKGHVSLSLKRVSQREADEKLKEIKRGQKAERLIEMAAKELGLPAAQAKENMGEKLKELFGEAYKAFVLSLTPTGKEQLLKKGIPEKWVQAISSVAEKNIEIKEIELRAELELKSSVGDGIEKIKKALLGIESTGIDVKYISAPVYRLSMRTKDAKAGDRKMEQIAAAAIKSVGEGGYKKIEE
ncbi:MAG: S1 RNA-binding domain-containing protein [Candidatus Aenigmarchaeota archaeon]|nr:S1 RNA-binding domain-containing protein [Candidatus Aenigmarchaeota archaeon]